MSARRRLDLALERRAEGVADVFLDRLGGILREDTANLVECVVNGPMDVWLLWDKLPDRPQGEVLGHWERRKVPGVDRAWIVRLCQTLATATGRVFREEKPMLGCAIPGPRHRFQGLVGPNVESGFAAAIRVQRRIRRALDEWDIACGGAEEHARGRHRALPPPGTVVSGDDAIETCIKLMQARASMLISGATGASKTSFLNALLYHLPRELRVVTVQDVEELDVANPNWVSIVVSRTDSGTDITLSDVIDSILRFLPQVVISGELSVANVRASTRLLNTGHGGFITTAHANSALDAFFAWRLNYELALADGGGSGDASAVVPMLARGLDALVHIEARGRRRYATIVSPQDLNWRTALRT